MIVFFKYNKQEDIDSINTWLDKQGVTMQVSESNGVLIGKLSGNTCAIDSRFLYQWQSVLNVVVTDCAYPLASKSGGKKVVSVGNVQFGQDFVLIGGPCTIEGYDDLLAVAQAVAKNGGKALRGGAYKPRTSPYSYQGMGEDALAMLERAGKESGLLTVSEIPDIALLEQFEGIDILQVGARNMQNFTLLKQLGKCDKPILLKRGMSNTVAEWLLSAEYILNEGNDRVILCDRGTRVGDRCVVDVTQLVNAMELTCLPIIVDPSHACGNSRLVAPLSKAVVSVGVDGLIIEVNANCEQTMCDGVQSLSIAEFEELSKQTNLIKGVLA